MSAGDQLDAARIQTIVNELTRQRNEALDRTVNLMADVTSMAGRMQAQDKVVSLQAQRITELEARVADLTRDNPAQPGD